MFGRLRPLLRHRHLDRYVAALALALTLPSLSDQLVFDDYVLGLQARATHDVAGLRTGPFGDLFRFTTGEPETNRDLITRGALLPWWSDPQHRNAFFRPLASLTHRLDFACFPDSPWLMHLHSWLWFGLLLVVAHRFYRSLQGAGVQGDGAARHDATQVAAPPRPRAAAGLAFALFALDAPHGATLSWIANRNALVALCLAMPALIAHRRAVRSRAPLHLAVGPLWLGLGLLAGETALGALGYLAAHVLVLEQDAWRQRILRLLPYGVPLLLWRLVYHHYGLGSFGSDAYHDPIREPAAFALALGRNLPVLAGAQLSVPYADLAFWGPPEIIPVLLALSAAVIGGTLWLGFRLLARDPLARFYGLGALLAAIPVSASLPGQRLLLGVSFGAAGFLAQLLRHLWRTSAVSSPRPQTTATVPPPAIARLGFVVLFILHVPMAAAALPLTARSMTWVGDLAEHIARDLPQDPGIAEQTLVIVNAPFDVMASYVQLQRAYRGRPGPAHLYWLSTASSRITVTREGQRALLVEPQQGFLWSAQERHYRRDVTGLRAGAAITLPGMTARVVSTRPDGRPKKVRFEFPTSLEDPSIALFVYRDGRYLPWDIPGPGEPRHFSQEDFFARLARQVVLGE